MEKILDILGDTYTFLMVSYYVIIIILIPVVTLYFLSTTLFHMLSKLESTSTDINENSTSFIKLKIVSIGLGIIYCFLILAGIIITILEPSWFKPPVWLIIFSIVLFVPYFACVACFIGLGNIGRSGFSQWKGFKSLLNDIKVFLKIA